MGEHKDKSYTSLKPKNSAKNLDIFKDNNFVYLYSKAEKVAIALYMITNFIPSNEPLKWKIRGISMKLLDSVTALNRASLSSQNISMRDVSSYLFQLKSVFTIAFQTGFVSEMNHSVVDAELNSLASFLGDYGTGLLCVNSELFKKTFFEEEYQKGHSTAVKDNIYKGHSKTTHVLYKKTQKDKVTSHNSDRRDKILNVVKKHGNVSIKDISAEISECSEKTLQRELLRMVSDGLLRKEGERRWSKYSMIH